jgi:hypothetical protein
MKMNLPFALKISALSILLTAFAFFPAAVTAQVVGQITSSGTTTPISTTIDTSTSGTQLDSEIDQGLAANDSDGDVGIDLQGNVSGKTTINRTIAPGPGQGQTVNGNARAKSNPEVITSFDGLNFFQQRFANNGNQFSVVPPDQGLCAGNGFVLETVNDVMNVYGADGTSLLGVTDLNTFLGYPPAINRHVSPLTFGPSVTDPSCHFDPDTQRWFHVALTLDRVAPTTQSFSGKNHLDIAVSTTANPLDPWMVFHLPVQDDGTNGTPDHNCQARVRINGVPTLVHAPCLGDYPHLGMDANGLYITTNEFNFFSPGFFHGSQIYAISKRQLVAGGPANFEQFDTTALAPTLPYMIPGFTVWPSLVPGTNFKLDNGGTEFALSSLAVFSSTGAFNQLVMWDLTNTQSLDSSPAIALTAGLVNTQTYAVPPASHQKAGDFPLGQCLADGTISTPFGTGCWRFFVISPTGPFPQHEPILPSNDSRMQQVFYANGRLWAALDTGVLVNGNPQAGAAFFVLQPKGSPSIPSATVVNQGIVALANNNLTYPAVGVTPSGRGVMAFTVLGADNYPSAGYTSLDALVGAGDVHIVAPGAGPDDGFSAYFPEANPPRPRWGDYGAAAVDGNTIWFASEYTAQTCNLSTFIASNFLCGNTRGSLGNWATHITHANLQ